LSRVIGVLYEAQVLVTRRATTTGTGSPTGTKTAPAPRTVTRSSPGSRTGNRVAGLSGRTIRSRGRIAATSREATPPAAGKPTTTTARKPASTRTAPTHFGGSIRIRGQCGSALQLQVKGDCCTGWRRLLLRGLEAEHSYRKSARRCGQPANFEMSRIVGDRGNSPGATVSKDSRSGDGLVAGAHHTGLRLGKGAPGETQRGEYEKNVEHSL
jgi:hypothetical protein